MGPFLKACCELIEKMESLRYHGTNSVTKSTVAIVILCGSETTKTVAVMKLGMSS
jgi:hypothetical protein